MTSTKSNYPCTRLLAALLLLVPLGLRCENVAAGETDLVNRFENVQRLIESSSGAERVNTSGNAAARDTRETARRLYAQAQEAHAQGDARAAGELLGQASRSMFEAMRLAASPATLELKPNHDFDDRARSVEALAAALRRIAAEKSAAASAATVADEVSVLLARGRTLRDAGQLDEGRRVLDEAYEQAKRGIEHVRGGQTLVRALEFSSKEQEYAYEVDRNDTHQMLLEVLAKDGRKDPGREKMVNDFVARARQLREQAKSQALNGDHDAAVKTLELSTKEFIRAIRSSGIYIPG